jgi:hypothetical protein
MAKGSRRRTPFAPSAAAVVSEAITEPRNTPWFHENASATSGTVARRRPPSKIAAIGTPCGASNSGEIDGHCDAGAVKRELGCANGSPPSVAARRLPFQSVRCAVGGSSVSPSHHGSPASVTATLVKTVFVRTVATAFGLVFGEVPGATPKEPGLRVDRP